MLKGTRFWQVTVVCATLSIGTAATAAGLYKWVDEQGNTHYTQDPPPKGGFTSITPPPAAAVNPDDADKQLEQAKDTLTPPPPPTGEADEKKRQAVADKANCDAAKKNLDIYTRYRRIVNDKGELVVLDDNERKAKIKEAEEMIKKSCK